MQSKLKDDDDRDAGHLKTKPNKTCPVDVSPSKKHGRRSKTASPACPSSMKLKSRRSATSTPERQSPSILSTGGIRAISLTPGNSSTQRELKKLEDYWTRNNPVKEDSPRLRSNRKVIFNIKDCFGERKSPKTLQNEVKSDPFVNTCLQKCLPESPIPDIQQADQMTSQNTASRTTEITDVSLDQNKRQSNIPNVSDDKHEHIQTKEEKDTNLKASCNDQIEPTSTENRKPCKEDAEPNVTSGVSPDITEFDSSDSDDDDYVPPRKKLRSEVSQDELWDGIPLTVSFKRLAPIPKLSPVKAADNSLQCEKNERGDDMIHFTKPLIYRSPIKTDVSFTGQTSESGIKRKRSTRLKEKISGTSTKSNNTNVLSVKHSPVVHDTLIDNSSEPENSSPKTHSIDGEDDGNSKTDMNETILYANKEEEENEDVKAANDNPGDTLLALTLSQILSDDNKSNDLNVLMSNGKIEDDEKTVVESGNKKSPTTVPTCVTSSFSETINEIFEEISGPDDLSKEQSEEKDACKSNCVEENCPKMMTRRSRRLSGIETEAFKKNQPHLECDRDSLIPETSHNINTAKGEMPQTEHTKESTRKTTDVESSSSKHTLFTKKQNRCLKTVPPLRIKLKQSVNRNRKDKCMSKSNQTSEKTSKEKIKVVGKVELKDMSKNKELCELQEKHSDFSEKGLITPLKNKKKRAKQRKWSPPTSTIELRLNSERRLSAAGSLLSNPILNKHACVLWSSENRRHMQLSNPHATLHELDAKLSRKWDSLSEKEKLRYFQRARDAIKDENRHSNRRLPDSANQHSNSNPTRQYEEDCSVENFQKLSPALQMSEIRKWLNFYNEVSPDTFSMVIKTFKETLAEENKNTKEKEKVPEKTKVKPMKQKQKKKEEQVTKIDSNANYRKMLFEKIQEQKENVKDVLTMRRKEQSKLVLESFNNMVKRMVSGEVFQFTGDVRSDKLTETLFELRALEKENKLAVTGNVAQHDKEFENILEKLRSWNSPDGKSLVRSLGDVDIDAVDLENTCKKIIQFPTLSPKSLVKNLPDIIAPAKSEVNLFSPLRIERINRTSPVSVLTDMVADDIMKKQPQIGFRNAISLLSNKIVPSPTILPPSGANINKPSGNRNQNCNVVFTKLLNSRSSVVSTKVNLLN